MFSVDLERVFSIDRPTMWRLWTDPEHASRWMRPSVTDFAPTIATIDPRPGGAYRFEMIAGSGEVHAVSGVFAELAEPERLAFTWAWDGSDEASFVEVLLTEVPGGTKVRILHSKLPTREAADEHEHGWIGCLGSLDTLY